MAEQLPFSAQLFAGPPRSRRSTSIALALGLLAPWIPLLLASNRVLVGE